MGESQQLIPFRVTRIVTEASDIKTFYLHTDREVPYSAGQFLTFVFSIGSKELRRSYSFITTPEEGIAITVKKVDNGIFSRRLVEGAKVGDVLYSIVPTGTFVAPAEGEYDEIFFFAAGIGITPVWSLMKQLLQSQPDVKLVLVYSNQSKEQTLFYNEIEQLKVQYTERLRVVYLFSNNQDLGHARLSKEVLPDIVKAYETVPGNRQLFYMCGPLAYMRMVGYALEEMNYTASQVKREVFNTQIPVQKLTPADKAAHPVIVAIQGKEYRLQVQYPETILSTAKKQDVPLPYSCETGMCGSCAVHCAEGEVWMSYNEILTPKELSEGKVLTCTGFPINGSVKIVAD